MVQALIEKPNNVLFEYQVENQERMMKKHLPRRSEVLVRDGQLFPLLQKEEEQSAAVATGKK